MNLNLTKLKFLFFLILYSALNYSAQEIDITDWLKKIERGEKKEVIDQLQNLKQKYPNSSSVLYLTGLLTDDGNEAVKIFESIFKKFPKSNFADDAVYRIYRYYDAVDNSEMAQFYLTKLRNLYSGSPYLKLAEKENISFANKETSKLNTLNTGKTPSGIDGKAGTKEIKFTIQAGAFTRRENALKLKNDIEKSGYEAQLSEKFVGGALFHVVYIGKFNSENEAKKTLNLINAKFKLQGWVIELAN